MLSNRIRRAANKLEITTEKMTTLACKEPGTIAIGKAGAGFLVNRSWQGLEQKIGESTVEQAKKGRSGLPINYENEPVRN